MENQYFVFDFIIPGKRGGYIAKPKYFKVVLPEVKERGFYVVEGLEDKGSYAWAKKTTKVSPCIKAVKSYEREEYAAIAKQLPGNNGRGRSGWIGDRFYKFIPGAGASDMFNVYEKI